MTVNETGMILAKIKSTFTEFKAPDAKATVASWTDILKNESYEDVNKAWLIYAGQDREHPPRPGQLRAIIRKYKPGAQSTYEVMNAIKYALRNAIYGAEQEFARLPKAAQVVLGSPGELRRISTRGGLDSYMEHSLIKRLEEYNEVLQIRTEHLAIEGSRRLEIESKESED